MATAELTREEMIDKYVTLEALTTIVERVDELARQTMPRYRRPMEESEDILSVGDGYGNSVDLVDVLWPGDDDLESDEYLAASARSFALAAAFCAVLVGPMGNELLVREAMSLSKREAQHRAAIKGDTDAG
jgi:hypothetical protein